MQNSYRRSDSCPGDPGGIPRFKGKRLYFIEEDLKQENEHAKYEARTVAVIQDTWYPATIWSCVRSIALQPT